MAVAWYVVRTTAQAEFKVQRGLREQGVEAYLPVENRWRHTRHAKRRIDKPLFTGYLFAGLDADRPQFWIVRNTDGVAGMIGVDGRPAPVQFSREGDARHRRDDFSIEALREAETLGLFDFTRSKKITFAPGDPIRVTGSHFKGAMGSILNEVGDKRIRILIASVGGKGSWPMTLNLDQIEAV